MKLQILPSAHVTITFNKSNEAFFEALRKIVDKNKCSKTQLVCSDNYFIIRRTLNGRSHVNTIYTEGLIRDYIDTKNVNLQIKVQGSSIIIYSLFWYLANLVIFILLLTLSITKGSSFFCVLLPIAFAGLGWYFTTGVLKVEIETLIEEIKLAAK